MKRRVSSILIITLMLLSVMLLSSCDMLAGLIPGLGGPTGDPTNPGFKNSDMKAVYEIYSEYTIADGKTPLSFEEWFASIGSENYDPAIAPVFKMNKETDFWEISYNNGDYNGGVGIWYSLQFKTITAEQKKCEHNLGDWVIIYEANGYFNGISCRTCEKCGYEDYKFRIGHDWQDINDPEHVFVPTVYEPDCISGGFTIYTCECGAHYEGDNTDPLGHNFIDLTFNATCEEWGGSHVSCSRCGMGVSMGDGSTLVETSTPALGHNFEDGVCTQCGIDISEHEHEYDYDTGEYVDVSCTEHAYSVYSCIHCDYSYKHYRDHQEPFGHFYNNGYCGICGDIEDKNHQHSYQAKFTLEPTCEDGGYTFYICNGCGQSYRGDTINATGHSYQDEKCATCERHQDGHVCAYTNVMTFESYCMFPGYTAHVCKCGNYYIDSVKPLADHTYQNGYCVWCVHKEGDHIHQYIDAKLTPESCEEALKITFTCSCGYSYSVTGGRPLGHDFEGGGSCIRCGANHEHNYRYSSTVMYPTCTEQGYTIHYCSCGQSYKDNYKDALGHYYSDDHRYGKYCIRCDADKTGHIHTYELEEIVDPTCKDWGYHLYICQCGETQKAYSESALGHEYANGLCIRCGHVEGDHEHSYNSSSTKHPNCTVGGYTIYYCECGDSYTTDYLDPLGHDMVNGVCTRCGRDENQHEHSYTETVTPPTCTESGYVTYSCECGHTSRSDYAPAEGHSLEWHTVTEATCTEWGEEIGECSKCDHQESNSTPPLGHNMVNGRCSRCGSDGHEHGYSSSTTLHPNCTIGGYTTYHCECGYSYTTDYTAPLGHNYVDGVCTRCGSGGHEHSYSVKVIDPTCTSQGYTVYTCVCGDFYTNNYTNPLEHSLGEWTIITEATCEGYGHSEASCTVCGETMPNDIPPLGHNFENELCMRCGAVGEGHQHSFSETVVAPTCTAQGYTIYMCICSHTYTGNYTDPIEHSLGEWQTITESSCVSYGWGQAYCTRCDYCESAELPLKDHSYNAVVIEPTCYEQGYTNYTCTVCSIMYQDSFTEPRHTYTTVVTPPTCTAHGYTMYYCTNCGNSTIGDFAGSIEHNYQLSFVHLPSCVEGGYTYYVCSMCQNGYASDYTEATGHNYRATAIVLPSCTESGYTTYACENCGDSYESDYTVPNGHSYEGIVTDPTCEEQGYTTYTCTVCGNSYNADYVNPKEHQFIGGVCTVCYDNDPNYVATSYSTGLTFSSNGNRTCSVTGIGSCSDTNINIPKISPDGETVVSIGEFAFSNCYNLTSVVIPDSVISIGDNAFMGCENLAYIVIPNSVRLINEAMFYGCSNLTDIIVDKNNQYYKSIDGNLYSEDGKTLIQYAIGKKDTSFEISNNVTTIGNRAFQTCRNLTNIVIPDSVTFIGDYAFSGCANLTSVVTSKNTAYIGDGAFAYCYILNYIDIPNSVTYIGNGAFNNCSDITSIVIPEGVTFIGFDAFNTCISLSSITIPNSVTYIGNGAFYNCFSLSSIVIPDNVTSIGDNAFNGCSGLTKVTMGNRVTSIGDYAFNGCSSLSRVYYKGTGTDESNINFGSDNGYMEHALWYYYSENGPATMGNFWHFVNGVITIWPTCASTTGHKYQGIVTYPTCTEQGYTTYTCTFCDLSYVGNYTDPAHKYSGVVTAPTCTEDGYTTFTCTECGDSYAGDYTRPVHKYTSVVTTPGCDEYGFTEYTCTVCGYSYTENYTEPNGHNYETTVVAPDCDDKGYTTYICIVCGDSYNNNFIEPNGHSYKTTVITPDCDDQGYTTYTCIVCGNSYNNSFIEPNGHKYESIVTAPNCENHGYTTYTCTVCNDSYTADYIYIGHKFTYGVCAACGYNDPDYVATGYSTGLIFSSNGNGTCSVTGIGSCVDNVILVPKISPDGDAVISIGDSAFKNCANLISIIIPDSIISIGDSAFYNCDNFTTILISNSVISIGNYTFGNCDNLTSVIIPKSVTSIGYGAFYNCDSITSIIIPNSVVTISNFTFSNCDSLTSVVIPDSVTSIGEGVFQYCSSLTSVVIPDRVTSIGDDAFYNCSSLTNIVIPNSVTSIGNYAFYSCDSLINVVIPNSVISIGGRAFSYCTSLTKITIPNSVTFIGEEVFNSCDSLTSVVIPDSVTSIGDYAFYNCSNLTSVVIGDSVTSIGSYTFYDCSSLTEVYYNGSAEEWNSISIGYSNDPLKNATRYYYSETKPTMDGNFWHWGENGEVVVWK